MVQTLQLSVKTSECFYTVRISIFIVHNLNLTCKGAGFSGMRHLSVISLNLSRVKDQGIVSITTEKQLVGGLLYHSNTTIPNNAYTAGYISVMNQPAKAV